MNTVTTNVVRLAQLNIISIAWLVGYPLIVGLLLPLIVGRGVIASAPGNEINLMDVVAVALPWVVPVIVFGRHLDGSRYYSTTEILSWAAVPVLLFIGVSMTQVVWSLQASVLRSAAILLMAIAGWTLMILWWLTFGLLSRKNK